MTFRLLFTVINIGLLTLISACGGDETAAQQQAPPPPVPISAYTVQEGNAVTYDQFPATVTALTEVEIRPQVAGYITGIFFTDGQRVTKGMKLYQIDQQQYQANYNQTLANLNVARANLARAQQDADRYQQLAEKDAIAKQTLDHAKADLEANRMQVAAAEAAVQNVKSTLGFSVIRAPVTGTIGISQVKLGTAVSPGQTVLNVVSSDNPLAADFFIDEKLIPRFARLQKAGVPASDSTFTLVLPDQTTYPYPGRLAFLDRSVDPQTGTLKARVTFPNPDFILKPGLNCVMRVKNDGNQNQILIPYKAVVEQMGEYFVFVVQDSIVRQVKVALSARINENVIAREGLTPNTQIAVEGIQKLKDSTKVTIAPAPAS